MINSSRSLSFNMATKNKIRINAKSTVERRTREKANYIMNEMKVFTKQKCHEIETKRFCIRQKKILLFSREKNKHKHMTFISLINFCSMKQARHTFIFIADPFQCVSSTKTKQNSSSKTIEGSFVTKIHIVISIVRKKTTE